MSDTKKCPYCAEEIKAEAKKCRFCGEWFEINETMTEDNINQFNTKDEEQKNVKINQDKIKKKPDVATKQCRTCKEEIKKEATSCPYCGEKDQTGIYAALGAIVLLVFAGFVIFMLILLLL